jgi:hypothetical protein
MAISHVLEDLKPQQQVRLVIWINIIALIVVLLWKTVNSLRRALSRRRCAPHPVEANAEAEPSVTEESSPKAKSPRTPPKQKQRRPGRKRTPCRYGLPQLQDEVPTLRDYVLLSSSAPN